MTEELKSLPCECYECGFEIVPLLINGEYAPACPICNPRIMLDTIKDLHTRSTAWRDIESAPRDGTPVLAFGLGKSPDGCGTNAKCLTIKFDGAEWVSMDDGYRPYLTPTHWMPLPLPPEEGRG